jgi:hypothetical protein
MAKRSNAAGGHGSRNVVEKPVKTGVGARANIPAGVAQLGQRQGNHATERGKPTGYGGVNLYGDRGFNKSLYGNEVALNVGGGGPGVGRKVYPTGSQCMTGEPDKSGNPTPKEIFP